MKLRQYYKHCDMSFYPNSVSNFVNQIFCLIQRSAHDVIFILI